ncbi:hypothetical protein IB265_33115 [Ensifer sp. ENS10]|nr:hypothetical protein [Ensifer sp. ENS10]MBD9511599.1 hypothetical protein [Ensifer sp. ENS10]
MFEEQQTFKEWILAQAQDIAGLAVVVALICAITAIGLHFTPERLPV